MKVNVRDFGATGDGCSLDSPAIEAAIGKAVSDGWGEVVLSPGTYLCASIDLPGNLILHLEPGAQILACRDIKAYRQHRDAFQGQAEKRACLRHYLLGAFGQKNIIIRGGGSIEGSGDAFWETFCRDGTPLNDPTKPPHDSLQYRVLQPKNPRPVLLYFWECGNLQLRDFQLRNAASYTVWMLGCEQVKLENLNIRNPRHGPNTDALDIDCCSHVTVTGCDIYAGYDCIAVKSDTSRLGYDRNCERILVSNCLLSSSACGVRLGYEGDGTIRDCVFNNLVIYHSKHAIDMLSLTPSPRPDFLRGTPIENILFSSIILRDVSRAFYIWCGSENPERQPYRAAIRGLQFNSMHIQSRTGSFIGSKDGCKIDDLTFRDISMQQNEQILDSNRTPPEYPGIWGSDFLPDGLWLHRIKNICFENFKMRINPAIAHHPPFGRQLRWNQVEHLSWNGNSLENQGCTPWVNME